ncbi:hypothetical protein SUGI_0107620 [Cryptomeria japonica]|nr:hypothetical protein SUGI_0107620 [Cryptomeria japonica]
MATVFLSFASAFYSSVTRRSQASFAQQWMRSATSSRRHGKSVNLSHKIKFAINTTKSSPGVRSSPSSNNVYKSVAAPNPDLTVPASKSLEKSLDQFISQFENLIQVKMQTIQAKRRIYKPFSEEWAESFYHIKGKHTRATCFSQDQIPTLLKNIANLDYRRDFVLYKDIPTMVVISDFLQNFGIKESPEVDHLEYEPIPLSHDASLPKGYQSLLLEEDESLPLGYHIILNSPSIRIFSHVTGRELLQSWKLDPREQEKQVRSIYRRNKWPFTEKVE